MVKQSRTLLTPFVEESVPALVAALAPDAALLPAFFLVPALPQLVGISKKDQHVMFRASTARQHGVLLLPQILQPFLQFVAPILYQWLRKHICEMVAQ
jgi:hypothetical protein